MSSDNTLNQKSLLETISGRPTYVLITTQLVMTVLVIGTGYCFVCMQRGVVHYPTVYTPFAIATMLCGIAIGISIAIGHIAFRKAANKVTAPLTAMANTAARLSQTRETTHFATDSDILEIVKIAEAFNALYDAQERQIDELVEMIRSLMHDIRTPLTHIVGQTEIIEANRGNNEMSAQAIKNCCNVISRLIDDHSEIMLNSSHSDRTPLEDVDVSKVITDGCDLYEGLAEAKGLTIKCSVPSKHIVFHGHKRKIQRLLANFIDNSIKYTPSGGNILIILSATESQFALTVSDTGIGIPPSEQPRIFDKRFRGSSSRHSAGYGLGLAMVKSIVSFYGGTITFSSNPCHGTTFSTVIPLFPSSHANSRLHMIQP